MANAKQMARIIVSDRVHIIEGVLQSLEYHNERKVEGDIVARLCERFNVSPSLRLGPAAHAFAETTTAEAFLGETLRLLGPYVAMLRDIYRLLEHVGATESGTAERLRLDYQGMRRECRDLPISEAFLRRIRETYVGWRERNLVAVDWNKLGQLLRYDGRFYGKVHGVLLPQVLTFTPTLLSQLRTRGLTEDADRINAALAEVRHCLEAIVASADCDHLNTETADLADTGDDVDSAIYSEPPLSGEYVTTIRDDLPGVDITARLILSLSGAMDGRFPPPSNTRDRPRAHQNENLVGGILVLLTILNGRIERPWPDYPNSPNTNLLPTLDEFSREPRQLAESIERFVQILNEEVARPTGTLREQALLERGLEMIDLPFWKDRASLYEVWVLVRTAQAVSAIPFLRAVPRLGRENDTAVLRLPKGDAKQPIFDVEVEADESRKAALLWFQRRTPDPQHRFFGAYEPDIRCTRASPPYVDLFVVECKDRERLRRRRQTREHPEGEGFEDVAKRYLDALPADLLWLVNYSAFAEEATTISRVDGRTARFAENFQPGQTPVEFDRTIRDVLEWQLARLLPTPCPTTSASPVGEFARLNTARLVLNWQNVPADLDLYLWREDYSQVIHYGHRGTLAAEPWAELLADMTKGFGPEEIRFARFAPVRYVVAVHNYSADSPLVNSDAKLTLELDGTPIYIKAPLEGDGKWWHVLEIDGSHGTVQIVNALRVLGLRILAVKNSMKRLLASAVGENNAGNNPEP